IIVLLSTWMNLGASAPTAYAQVGGNLFLPLVNTEGNSTSPSLVESVSISPADQRKAQEFWTHAKIASATPLQMAMESGPLAIDSSTVGVAETAGAPGFAAGGSPATDADSVAQAAYPNDWAALEIESAGVSPDEVDGTSQVYTHYIVNQSTALW